MVKSSEKTESAIIDAPQQVKTVVSFKATVPLLQYGNIEMFVSQEFYTDASEPDLKRDVLRASLMENLRQQVAEQILSLAEAEVLRAKSQLVLEKFPDSWMQRNNPIYRWLRVAAPDMTISAMQEIIGHQNIALD